MSVFEDLKKRSGSVCELCTNPTDLRIYEVPPKTTGGMDGSILICNNCSTQLAALKANNEAVTVNHWRCLNDAIWNENDAVKVVAWRILSQIKKEGWPQDLLDMMYLEEEALHWAKATGAGLTEDEKVLHKDVNGVVLKNGDSVVLIKDLKVKGSSIVAKQGTAVRRISVDRENAEYVEGKVGAQQIVIITKYVKKL